MRLEYVWRHLREFFGAADLLAENAHLQLKLIRASAPHRLDLLFFGVWKIL